MSDLASDTSVCTVCVAIFLRLRPLLTHILLIIKVQGFLFGHFKFCCLSTWLLLELLYLSNSMFSWAQILAPRLTSAPSPESHVKPLLCGLTCDLFPPLLYSQVRKATYNQRSPSSKGQSPTESEKQKSKRLGLADFTFLQVLGKGSFGKVGMSH